MISTYISWLYIKTILQNNFVSSKILEISPSGFKKIKIVYSENDAYFFLDFVKCIKIPNSCQFMYSIDMSWNVPDEDVSLRERNLL